MAADRILLDTNVLVSAAMFGGKPRRCVELAEAGRFTLVSSIHILQELADVLARPNLNMEPDDIAALVEELAGLADVVPVEGAGPGTCRDIGDEPVLLAAVLGKADGIVTGDRDLLEMSETPVSLLTVDRFLATLGEAG